MTRPISPAAVAALADEALGRCDALAAESESPERLRRTFLRPPMRRVHDRLAGWMREAGMSARLDPAGNLIGRHPATSGDAPAILIGSHLDTVPDAGKYDGALGVVLGVAAVEALRGRRLPAAVEVVGFVEEEGVRFRTPYLGSLAMAGRFRPDLLGLLDSDGTSMADAYRAYGLDPGRIGEAARRPGSVAAYIEPHIEQGPVLEEWDLPVGIVEAITGQSRLRVSFEGLAGHAGTTPMGLRRDALPAAAELVLEAERLAQTVLGLRATVGTIAAQPGASNVIPGSATLSLDVRHAIDEARERAVAELLERAEAIASRRGLTFRVFEAIHNGAVPADPGLADRLAAAVHEAGVEPRWLVSGAGHDAAVMASLAPMAMLFLRSPGGISHHPDEAVRREDVAVALDVLVRFVDRLARDHRAPGVP